MDGDMTKKYLTNSDKSIYNLQWQLGAVERSKPQRFQNNTQNSIRQNPNGPRGPEFNNNAARSRMNRQRVNFKQAESEGYNSPYANANGQQQSFRQSTLDTQKTEKIITPRKPKVKQSDRAVNLVRNPNRIRVVHHYVDSSIEANKLIWELQQKGYVEPDDDDDM